MKKGKTLGKRAVREEVKREVEKETGILSSMKSAKGSPYQLLKASEMLQNRAYSQIDVGYIKTLLFPELYNADVPQPMSTQSYCRFTDKKEVTIPSGVSANPDKPGGCGMLIWYPKTVIGPSIFIRYGLDTPIEEPLSFAQIKPDGWKAAGYQDYSPYFSQANLVSASISLQYIGQLQNEQGYFVGGQIFGVNPGAVTTDDIENGQFRVMSKPGDGIRLTYLPKDLSDFSYYPVNGKTAPIKAGNGGQRPTSDKQELAKSTDGNSYLPPATGGNIKWPMSGSNPINIEYQTDTDMICIYWKGLHPGTADLRIDSVRKFNGFPHSAQRDFLDLTKPKKLFDPKTTIDVIQELQTAIPSLVGHSLKQMDRVSDQIQEFLPNIGHLYNEGMLKEGTSLEGFAGQLQMIAGNEGTSTSFPGRVYD